MYLCAIVLRLLINRKSRSRERLFLFFALCRHSRMIIAGSGFIAEAVFRIATPRMTINGLSIGHGLIRNSLLLSSVFDMTTRLPFTVNLPSA